MWEYRVRKTAAGIDIAGAWGYSSKEMAILAYKRRFAQWEKYHCVIYSPEFIPCAKKDAGEIKFSIS